MYELSGISRSGFSTCITVKDLGLCFDIGECTDEALKCKYVAISHGHLDHLAGIFKHANIRHMCRQEAPVYIAPEWLVETIHEGFYFWAKLQGHGVPPYTIETGDEVYVAKNKYLKPFKTSHTIPSQGYILYDVRRKLKLKYKSLTQAELNAVAKSGVQLSERCDHPEIIFTGDTRIQPLLDMNLRCDLLITECTYLSRTEVSKGDQYGHIHIQEIVDNIESFDKAKQIVFCHLSKRYSMEALEEEVFTLLPGHREKISFL